MYVSLSGRTYHPSLNITQPVISSVLVTIIRESDQPSGTSDSSGDTRGFIPKPPKNSFKISEI